MGISALADTCPVSFAESTLPTLHFSMPLSPSIEPLESRIAPAFAAVFELSSLDGSNGFTINGVAADDHAGESVSDAGDVNGDGFADIIVSAPVVRVGDL